MADKMLIVHGYSDGSTSFTDMGDFFVEHNCYKSENIFYADYASMDDEATFRDFADKLDEDYHRRFAGERIDVACHSTGALVVRAWLAMHFERHSRRRLNLRCPVHRLLMFAPANFGSDLAGMGQSFLGKFRATFFNSHSFSEDAMESGRQVLQGLEPASPFQWDLSDYDLHGNGSGYFDPGRPAEERCYPFVFAAGESYGGIQAKIIKKRKAPGTDGTVRICGTSLNTKKCTVDFRDNDTALVWWNTTGQPSIGKPKRYDEIPFAVFAGFNHGSIVQPSMSKAAKARFEGSNGPGTLALEALAVRDDTAYRAAVERFGHANEANYAGMKGRKQDRYQQFFFRVWDDVEWEIDDFYADFFVLDADLKPHRDLTIEWDNSFESSFYRHSATPSCRVMMINLRELGSFLGKLRAVGAKLAFEITAQSSVPNVTYQKGYYVVYDGAKPADQRGQNFIAENTTTFVRAVMNRQQSSKLMNLKDSSLDPALGPKPVAESRRTGRAVFLVPH